MIYPPNPRYVGVAPSLNNIYTSVAAQYHQAAHSSSNSSSSTSSTSSSTSGYQQNQQTQVQNQQQQAEQQEIPVQLIQPRLPYHFPQQYYPDTKIENPMFIETTSIAPVPSNQTPPLSGGCTRSCCGPSASSSVSNTDGSKKTNNNNMAPSTTMGYGSVSSSTSSTTSSASQNSTSNATTNNINHGNSNNRNSSNNGNNKFASPSQPAKRSMSSSSNSGDQQQLRMGPRAAKSPAWSFPPMMSIPSPIQDDPSSCSDNASDHSDKLDSIGHHHSSSSHGKSHGHGGHLHHDSNSNSAHSKNRKRKIMSSFGGAHNSSSNSGAGADHLKENAGAGSNSNAQASLWADAESLAADFDGSLSGLGADLSSSSYDMSEALLNLPTIYHHNRGLASSSSGNANNNNSGGGGSTNSSAQHNSSSTNNANSSSNNNSSSSSGVGGSGGGGGGGSSATSSMRESELTPLAASHHHGGSTASLAGDFSYENRNSPSFQQHSGSSATNAANLDCERRFQYVLAAATSIATKVNEETITYLNQGQPYEIKLKKLGELTAYRGTVFKTVVRLCFHDRRLQFSEREQIALWEYSHPRDRILQVDLPLSYGVAMLAPTSDMSTNAVSFLWEPLKEVGLYVKVNCISTEFTPKKHGGEKGVPFRLMIETYSHPENVRLHAGACQVKVFKLKGADRKHKQDREKIMKKTPSEQAKLQPSYECTVLSDISLESLDSSPPPSIQTQLAGQTSGVISPTSFALDFANGAAGGDSPDENGAGFSGCATETAASSSAGSTHFSAHFSAESVRRWMVRNRFTSTKTLWDFNGLDLLRVNKDELIEMCGLAEGIRLYNALHYKITFFVTIGSANSNSSRNQAMSSSDLDENASSENSEDETTFHPICLSSPSNNELVAVLNSLLNPSNSYSQQIERVFLSVNPANSKSSNSNNAEGSNSNSSNGSASNTSGRRIRVLLNEQLLSTLKDQSAFKVFKVGSDVCLQLIE